MGTRYVERIGFGGGCYWCTEAVFQNLRGVSQVTQGFACSHPPNERPSEAVLIDYDPIAIGLADLIELHVNTHASTSRHSMRDKYRSAVYVLNDNQAHEAANILAGIQKTFCHDLVTRVLPLAEFEKADGRYRNYYLNNRNKAFCHRYIAPKLDTLRSDFAHLIREPTTF